MSQQDAPARCWWLIVACLLLAFLLPLSAERDSVGSPGPVTDVLVAFEPGEDTGSGPDPEPSAEAPLVSAVLPLQSPLISVWLLRQFSNSSDDRSLSSAPRAPPVFS